MDQEIPNQKEKSLIFPHLEPDLAEFGIEY